MFNSMVYTVQLYTAYFESIDKTRQTTMSVKPLHIHIRNEINHSHSSGDELKFLK